ncbi:hypothetical protein AVEN_260080-1 [Araneus ventricosus]|uniref:Uncharacterized protein n=1 Tax=Araneus ventricosus TaxID=182803 RepID=A0A4Y2G358_ARAVE|nr:hypothetical protein AVEN_260080-1 [Araneus ventricosus]
MRTGLLLLERQERDRQFELEKIKLLASLRKDKIVAERLTFEAQHSSEALCKKMVENAFSVTDNVDSEQPVTEKRQGYHDP